MVVTLIALVVGVYYFAFQNETSPIETSNGDIKISDDLTSVEISFKHNKEGFEKVLAMVGEDVMSSFYYIIYKKDGEIVVVREVWNGGATRIPEVNYYFFTGKQLLIQKTFRGKEEDIEEIINEDDENLIFEKKLVYDNYKLVEWIQDEEMIDSSDPRWIEVEQYIQEQVNYLLVKLEEIYIVDQFAIYDDFWLVQKPTTPPIGPTVPPSAVQQPQIEYEVADWRTYRNAKLGFEFKYPANYGEVEFLRRECFDNDGELFRISFSRNKEIRFGGDSENCAEPRGAQWNDFIYYKKTQDGKYIYYFAKDKNFEVTASKIIQPLEIVVINNQNLGLALQATDRVALLNMRGNIFKGIAFVYNNIPNEEEETFDQILSTFKFIK